MRRLLACVALSLSAFVTPAAVAGEIVSSEWIGNLLDVRYSPATKMVTCTLYNDQGQAVASGTAFPVGTVAAVLLSVPSKYAGTSNTYLYCE